MVRLIRFVNDAANIDGHCLGRKLIVIILWLFISGEMWVSVALAVLVELVPSNVRTTAVAVYLFIITNIGGNMPLLVPVLKRAFRASNLGLNTNADSLRGKE